MKRILSIALIFTVLLTLASFPTFSAGENHSRLTHLNGTNFIKTNLDFKDFSDFDRLFDGDSSALYDASVSKGTPDGNGIYSSTWYGDGETKYITIDLGDSYELSQINTYWGWAPSEYPAWNRWEYKVPSAYKIYVADTEEGLVTASPIVEVTDLQADSGNLADSFADVSVVCRYVKIVATCRAGRYALREVEFIGALSPRADLKGANIRLETDELSAGLRFGATIDKSLINVEGDWQYDPSSDTEFGMYLLPASMLSPGQTLTEYLADGQREALKVVAKKFLSQNDSTITYTAVLTDIPEESYNNSIVAVAYASVSGKTFFFNEREKSYAGVAKAAMNSYENGNPNNISAEQYSALGVITKNYKEPITYYDIDVAAKKQGLDYINAVLPASLFIDLGTSYIGYKIDGTYKVDADTLRMLAETPCIGNGKIKWEGYVDCGSWSGNLEQPEYVPVDLLKDPIYMSMILPSERTCYLASRKNAAFLDVAEEKWKNVISIGAVYKNKDIELPDDAEFTLCISDVNLALRTENSDGWFEAINRKVPTVSSCLYYLPWTLEHTIGVYKFPEGENRITYFDDHVEIKLYGYDLNGTEAKKVSDEVDGCVYHFWGSKYYFNCPGDEVLGVASSYKIWVKEPEAAEYLVAGIGADWRDSSEQALQAFAGYKHAITNKPVTVVGHNVELSRYRDVMDSEKVQEILGIK